MQQVKFLVHQIAAQIVTLMAALLLLSPVEEIKQVYN